ncbi:MAG: response regulator transcription factor [Bacteroidales bacterium]|nr:response regulator transcription factor [Bacteroidales bacterium]
MEPLEIILVDDHKIIRDGIRAMLLGQTRIRIAGEAAHAYELFTLLKNLCPAVVIMDIGLPRMSGIEAARVLKRDHPGVRILVLTANTDEQTIISSVRAGVHGFLPKDSSKDELIEAIHTVARGKHYFGKNISGTLFQTIRDHMTEDSGSSDKECLTDREIEIIRLFVEGLTFREVAERLYISPRTVETHKNQIMKKLGLRTTVDLVKYAIKNNLAPL